MAQTGSGASPLVGIVMGSESDWPVMKAAAEVCRSFGVPHEVRIVSAHRTPGEMADYGRTAHERGLAVIVAGAGGAAHLPGMLAANTVLPVIGVPVPLSQLQGMDSLLSIVQMPRGVPVATVAIGNATNAGLLAVQILAVSQPALHEKLLADRARRAEEVHAANRRVGELRRTED
ncbi:MAG TPA: 5-(carboxyamino)imidazole ribonucleotide mutase [Chloroflexota bacterium]|nr:5-(carboxyamino)imidazole ribonucleotide mutase [Chloroflexota bacterium]